MALQVWLPLNKDLRNLGLVNMNITSDNITFVNNALATGNITMDAATTNQILNNDAISIAFWLYVNSESNSTTGIGEIFGNSGMTAPNNRRYTVFQYPNVNTLHASWQNYDSNDAKFGYTISNFFPSYQWTHCTITYNREKREVCTYKNGELVSKYTGVYQFSNPTYAFDTKLISNNLYRYIYDFRIYNHALSKKEVAELARGCVLHYPMNDPNSQILENVFNYPTFNTSTSSAGWSHWGDTGVVANYSQNTNKDYIWNKSNTYSHKVLCASNSTTTYWTYQNPAYINATGYRSVQAIIKMEDGSVPDETKIKWTWNGGTGTVPPNQYIPLNDDFYLMKCDGFQQANRNSSLNNLLGISLYPGNTVYISEAYCENDKQVCTNILSQTHGSPNLNTANWTGGAGYWTITSQTINEIKFTKTSSQYSVIAIQNAVLKEKLPINTPITISGYLYNGDTPFKSYQSTINTQYNDVTVLSWESRDDGYFRYTFKYGNLNSNWLLHASFFGTRTEGDISYIRNMEWHITPYLKDVSGFDNHSLITGSLPLVTTPKSPRYDKCMNIDNSGTNKNYANCTIAAPQVKSASFWIYIGANNNSNQILFLDTISKLAFGFCPNHGNSYCLVATDYSGLSQTEFDISGTKKNAWNHFVINHLSSTAELYLNGVKLNTSRSETWGYGATNGFVLGRRMGGNGYSDFYYTGKVSDFRLFSRVLTQADVDNLYKDSLSIDKSQNGYCYELNESDAQSSVDVKKNGQLKCKNYYEACPDTYDSNIYTEPDGSQWIRIFHHNNPANALFSSSDTFTTGVYKDADRWFKVSLCNNVSKWELMVKQKLTSTSEQTKYRWIQYKNPMTAVFGDVDAADVTKYTSSQGYTDIASYMGGIYKMGGNTYMVQNNSTNGNWFGAIGSWSAYGGGIPSCGLNSAITNGVVDLYLRIDNLPAAELATLFTDKGNQIARVGKNSNVSANKLHEY